MHFSVLKFVQLVHFSVLKFVQLVHFSVLKFVQTVQQKAALSRRLFGSYNFQRFPQFWQTAYLAVLLPLCIIIMCILHKKNLYTLCVFLYKLRLTNTQIANIIIITNYAERVTAGGE